MTVIIKILLLISVLHLASVVGTTYEEQVTFTEKERAAIPAFKKRILDKIPSGSIVNEFVKDDLYLVRWLRAKNLDIGGAVQLFSDNLKWREKENMDNVHLEDWSDIEKEFPIFTDTYSKTGQPVSELWFSDWQARKAVISGKLKRAVKWVAVMFEMESRKLYKARAEGKSIAQAIMLVYLEGFTIQHQGCPGCLPIYAGTTSCLENYYPGMYETINLINMPSSFEIILRIVRPIMRPSTRKSLKVYPDETKWKPILDAKISKEERSPRFGGTKSRPALH